MRTSKKATMLLISSLLVGIGAPAWAGTAEQAAPANARIAAANPYGNTLLGMLSSVLTDTDPSPRQPRNQCGASHLYSQHDVVGDPEGCFMGRYTIGSGSDTIATGPSVP